MPVSFEPLSCQKAAVLTVIVTLPTGDDEFSPPDQCGIAMGSALVTLGLVFIFCYVIALFCVCTRWPRK